ncbi:MAG: hypothetical protein KAT25_08395 [Sulfuriflexus sp.]|nr:hypothetical protein [Sulfuriflexus sp.]
MNKVLRYGLQAFNYALFMAVVWYFSTSPTYHQLEDDQAVITLSFTHATKLSEECRRLTQEELLKLPLNMRAPMDCPRERSPLTFELYLDDKILTSSVVEPLGFHRDQGVNLFQRMVVKAGEYSLRIWLNDDINVDKPTYQYEQKITLKPEQQLLIDFDAATGGFFTK